jgi:hypothetical protein
VRTILESMIERLTNQLLATPPIDLTAPDTDMSAFTMFDNCVTFLIEGRADMPLIESLRLETLLVSFALKCFPTRMDYVSHCLYASSAFVAKTDFRAKCEANKPEEMESVNGTIEQIESLLLSPLSVLAIKVLDVPAYTDLMALLPWDRYIYVYYIHI